MDDQTLFGTQIKSLRDFYRALPSSNPAASTTEADGVYGTVFPMAPNRSVCNGVMYESADQLAASYNYLAREYAQAGINAWTVWVPNGEAEAVELLEASGHKLDATPRAMGMMLADFDSAALPDVEIDDRIDASAVGKLNDRAYKLPGGEFEASLSKRPNGNFFYGAHLDGDYRSCVSAMDSGSDCSIWFVATDPDARGRGLAAALMIRALLDARERGCETTTLQATKAGQPIYERLGYRDLGEMQMWELRSG